MSATKRRLQINNLDSPKCIVANYADGRYWRSIISISFRGRASPHHIAAISTISSLTTATNSRCSALKTPPLQNLQ
jgi:hypothetical protein